ncbi:MAG: hypothetical protein Q8R29_03350 [bacterium]|nr:hypothetical protein [bacterium]
MCWSNHKYGVIIKTARGTLKKPKKGEFDMSTRKLLLLALFLVLSLALLVLFLTPRLSSGAETPPPPDTTAKYLLGKYLQALPGSKERAGIVKELSVVELNHKQWFNIYNNPRTGGDLNRMVLDKLIETCETIEECDYLWTQIMGDHEVVKKLFNKILMMPQTVNQLFSLYKRIHLYDDGMESKVRKAIVQGWATPEELTVMCLFAIEHSLTRFELDVVDAIKDSDQPFDVLANMAVVSPRNSRLREMAIERMFKKIKKFDDSYETWKLVQDTDRENDALKLMFKLSETFVQKLIVLECSVSGSKIEKQVFEQLLGLANTPEKIEQLARRVTPGSKLEKSLSEKRH